MTQFEIHWFSSTDTMFWTLYRLSDFFFTHLLAYVDRLQHTSGDLSAAVCAGKTLRNLNQLLVSSLICSAFFLSTISLLRQKQENESLFGENERSQQVHQYREQMISQLLLFWCPAIQQKDSCAGCYEVAACAFLPQSGAKHILYVKMVESRL